MAGPLIAIVGDITPTRNPPLNPPMKDPGDAIKAAEDLGEELAQRGARLLVYGGPYLEADVVRGFVRGKPKEDKSVQVWYTEGNEPPKFQEETTHPHLFERRARSGTNWIVAFYRSITRADGIILMGGGNATQISGQVAIGSRMPILSFSRFGGGATLVWQTLAAGEDLPTRDEIDLMAMSWTDKSAKECVNALFAQRTRRQVAEGTPNLSLSIIAALLFLLALAVVPWVWGNTLAVWMLFFVPVTAGGAGGAIRLMVDRQLGTSRAVPAMLAAIILGLVAGGIAGVLFVTAQLTAAPDVNVAQYALRSIPFALGVGFVAGLTSDGVFGKLLGLDVIRVTSLTAVSPPKS